MRRKFAGGVRDGETGVGHDDIRRVVKRVMKDRVLEVMMTRGRWCRRSAHPGWGE